MRLLAGRVPPPQVPRQVPPLAQRRERTLRAAPPQPVETLGQDEASQLSEGPEQWLQELEVPREKRRSGDSRSPEHPAIPEGRVHGGNPHPSQHRWPHRLLPAGATSRAHRVVCRSAPAPGPADTGGRDRWDGLSAPRARRDRGTSRALPGREPREPARGSLADPGTRGPGRRRLQRAGSCRRAQRQGTYKISGNLGPTPS